MLFSTKVFDKNRLSRFFGKLTSWCCCFIQLINMLTIPKPVKMKKKLLIALMTLIGGLEACNHSSRAVERMTPKSNDIGSELLYRQEWRLVSLNDKPVPSGSKAMLSFTPGQVNKITGHTGCNRTNGSFELNGTSGIKFQSLSTTRMACTDAAGNEMETKFLAALNEATSWSIEQKDILHLKNAENTLATFLSKPAAGNPDTVLNGTWELSFIEGAKVSLESMFTKQRPTLIFNLPQLEISGHGGCNGFSAALTIDSVNLKIGDPLSTMMACEGNGEPVFFKALTAATSYKINNKVLSLMAKGEVILRFNKK